MNSDGYHHQSLANTFGKPVSERELEAHVAQFRYATKRMMPSARFMDVEWSDGCGKVIAMKSVEYRRNRRGRVACYIVTG